MVRKQLNLPRSKIAMMNNLRRKLSQRKMLNLQSQLLRVRKKKLLKLSNRLLLQLLEGLILMTYSGWEVPPMFQYLAAKINNRMIIIF